MSEKLEFLTFLAQVHRAFPNASAVDLVRNAQRTIEGNPPTPLKRIDPSRLLPLVKAFPILGGVARNTEISTSYDLIRELANSQLPPDERNDFYKTLL